MVYCVPCGVLQGSAALKAVWPTALAMICGGLLEQLGRDVSCMLGFYQGHALEVPYCLKGSGGFAEVLLLQLGDSSETMVRSTMLITQQQRKFVNSECVAYIYAPTALLCSSL
jgi:hypothetical protein